MLGMSSSPKRKRTPREKAAIIHKILGILNGLVFLGLLAAVVLNVAGMPGEMLVIGIAVFPAALALLHFFTAKGLKQNKRMAKVVSFIVGALNLFNFPIGTIIGVTLIIYVLQCWGKKKRERKPFSLHILPCSPTLEPLTN